MVDNDETISKLKMEIEGLKKELLDAKRLKDEAINIIRNSPMVFWTLDMEGKFTLSEGGGLKQIGLKPGQVVGMSVFDVYRDFPHIIEAQKRTLAGEKANYIFEMQGSQHVGDEIGIENTHFYTKLVPLNDNNGVQIGLLGVAHDITQMIKKEEKLKKSESRYRNLIVEAPIAIFVIQKGICKFVNPAAMKLFGYSTEEEIINKPTTNLVAPSVREQLVKRNLNRKQGIEVTPEYETIGIKKNGQEFPLYVYTRKVTFNNESSVLTYLIDLTDNKK